VGLPLVVDLRTGGPQHEVLEPVGDRPAGRVTGADAGTPGLDVLGRDLVAECHQLVHRGRDLPAVVLEHLRGVPDERLDVGAQRSGIEGPVDRAVLLPGRVEVLVDVLHDGIRRGHEGVRELGHQRAQRTRLRQVGDVRRVAGLDPDRQLCLELLGALVLDGRASALLEGLVGVDVRLVLRGDDRGVDGNGLAFEVAVLLKRGAVDVGALGLGLVVGAARRQHQAQSQPAGEDRRAPPGLGRVHPHCYLSSIETRSEGGGARGPGNPM
jgi:hypothetical protein